MENKIEKLWTEIMGGQQVRQNLSKIRELIKEEKNYKRAVELISGYSLFLEKLLEDRDAKIRKNTILLIGDLGLREMKTFLWEAYTKEETLFIRSAYLMAMKKIGTGSSIKNLKEREESLRKKEWEEENKKHITEELRQLRSLIIEMEGIKKHRFCDTKEKSEVILLANRKHLPEILEEIKKLPDITTSSAKLMQAGIRLHTNMVGQLFQVRTWTEMLFLVPGMKTCTMDAREAAKRIGESSLLEFLGKRHREGGPYYFRVEVKSEKVDKIKFIKKFVDELEQISAFQLINSPSHYEFEIRLVENKEGKFNIMVKLYTMEDERFSYRKEVIASSIRPVNAALLALLSEKYLLEEARVLDPFCGVGTMLIERNKKVKADTLYGVDILEEAVKKGRQNADRAGVPIHFINRDFFSFSHEYPFDEIFTNMPFVQGGKTAFDIYDIYEKFFDKVPEVLCKGGKLILYSHDKNILEKQAEKRGYKILEKIVINVKEDSWLYILEW